MTPEEELPPLPPIDDDGELAAVDDAGYEWSIGETHEDDSLDDSTNEGEPIEAFGIDGLSSEDGHLEGSEASDLDYDGSDTLVAGAESGLLQDSDEGDGRDVRPEETGMLQGDERDPLDDGGAEGTGEDPALAIDEESETERLSLEINPDDESIDEESLEDDDAGRARASFEREPWPPRADVAWTVDAAGELPKEGSRAGSAARREVFSGIDALSLGTGAQVTAEGVVVAALEPGGGLWISRDAGARFERIAGCASATAVAIVTTVSGGQLALAALYDAARDTSALARIHLAQEGTPVAELVAELFTGDGSSAVEEEMARVEALHAYARADGGLEAIAQGRFGTRRAKG